MLGARVAAHAPLDGPEIVARLLDRLREGGADVLARDPAAHVPLDDPDHDASSSEADKRRGPRRDSGTAIGGP